MITSDSSDSQLISACIAGDKKAWDIFVGRFSKLIYWSIHRTLENNPKEMRQEILEEVFQDIFRKLLENEELKKLQSVKNIRRFLIVLACRATLDRLKSANRLAKRMNEASQASTQELLPEKAADFVLLNERKAIFDSVLGLLSEKERACLEFCYLFDRTHKEIGVLMNLPQDTVSTIIRRTKEKLKEVLKAKGLEEKDF